MEETARLYRTCTRGEREELRTTRLLDARTRTIGVDAAGIMDQIYEKQRLQAGTKSAEEESNRVAALNVKAAQAVAAAVDRQKSQELVRTVGVWNVQRDKTLRREWDLSDPARVRNDTLPRDTRPLYETKDLGHTSGAQIFAGELLEDPAIPAEKNAALEAALASGVAERAAATAEHAHLTRLEDSRVLASAAAAEAHARHIETLRAAERLKLQAENAGMHNTRQQVEASSVQRERLDATKHVAHEEHNPFLREDTRLSVRTTDPHRWRPDHFKGFAKADVAQVYQELDRFALEKAELRQMERKVSEEEQKHMLLLDRAAVAVAERTEAERSARLKAYYADLAAAAQAKREKDAKEKAEARARQYPTATGLLAGFGKSLK